MHRINAYKDYTSLTGYIGQPINFRKLCEITGYIKKGGKLIKGKNRYITIDKIKQFMKIEETDDKKFIIKEIYNSDNYRPLPSQGKYKTFIKLALLRHLQKEGQSCTLTYSEIYNISGMVNSLFKFVRYDYYDDKFVNMFTYKKTPFLESEEYIEASIENYLGIFFSMVPVILNRIIKAALRDSDDIWIYNNSYRLFKKEEIFQEEEKRTITNKYDCTSDEYEDIESFREQTLIELGCKRINDLIYDYEKFNVFKAKVGKYICTKYKCDFYAKTFNFELTSKGKNINNSIPDCKRILNSNIKDKIKNDPELNKRIPSILLNKFIKVFIKL